MTFFMLATIRKITLIIVVNLLAFLLIWHILDAIFETGNVLKLASVLVSLPVLGIIMYMKAGKILQELQEISNHGTNDK